MRALHVPAAGEQPLLAAVPTPEPTEGTVLIRVVAAGLNPVDNAIAAGMAAGMMEHRYPLVLGRDAAGIVEAVGAGVDHVGVGDAVVGHVLFMPPIEAGTIAEYAVLPASTVIKKPASLDFVTAAALPLAAAAAIAAVDVVDPQPGQTVLVHGASGGVGSYAVQLLRQRGATVVATGTAADTERLRGLGAAEVVDFTAGPVAEQVRTAYPDGVDALVNLAGFTADDVPLAAVHTGGTVSTTTGAPDADTLAVHGLTGSGVMASPTSDVIGPLLEQAASGTLKVQVDTVLPFERAAEGLATLAAGQAHGKIVVTIAAEA